MKNKTIIFYDLEATSVARDADPVSIGLVAVTDYDSTNLIGERSRTIKTFYAEFTDYSLEKCDDWVKENVIDKLYLKHKINVEDLTPTHRICKGRTEFISQQFKKWLSQFESIEFWADEGNR